MWNVVNTDKGEIKRIPSPTVMSHPLSLIIIYRVTHPLESFVYIGLYSVCYKELTYISPSCQLSRKRKPVKSSDSSLEISQRRGHRHIIWLISFKNYQGIWRIQIIWLVFRYFSRDRTNNLTCLLIFLLWKDGMTWLTPIPYILHCSDVDNHYVIVSSHGTDVLLLLAHITRIPGRTQYVDENWNI